MSGKQSKAKRRSAQKTAADSAPASKIPERGEARVAKWKDYEQEIFREFRMLFPEAQVLLNQRMEGRSGARRQIDVLIRDRVAGRTINIVADGKFFARKVDVGEVESFIGLLRDVGADKGVLVTNVGYTNGALKRAHSEGQSIELDILTTNPINPWMFQAKWASPYVDSYGVLLTAPFGWVVDGSLRYGMPGEPVGYLYQRGMPFDVTGNAQIDPRESDFMYVNCWIKRSNKIKTLTQLLDKQEGLFERYHPEVGIEVSYIPMTFGRKDGADMRLRLARIKRPGFPIVFEYGGFVDFPDFIFFAILRTAEETASINLGKLEYVMERIIPLHMEHAPNGILMSAPENVDRELRDILEKIMEISHGH